MKTTRKRRKPGPKPRPKESKTTTLSIKLSKMELAAFRAAAKRDKMKLSPWLIEPRRKELQQ